jgi:predicted nucleic acid-binding protein
LKPVLVDTGFLVALYDRREPMNRTCLRLHEELENPLVTCEAVLTETLHLLNALPSAHQQILASVAEGILAIPFQLNTVAARVQATMDKYRDTPADFADACLIQMADELDTGDILTLDSGFRHYRWRQTRHFNLLIPLE